MFNKHVINYSCVLHSVLYDVHNGKGLENIRLRNRGLEQG
jgi:hypothetical protein